MTEAEQIQAAFKLVCKICGSDDVVIDITEPESYSYSDYTQGTYPGSIVLGCNACKQNDVHVSIG